MDEDGKHSTRMARIGRMCADERKRFNREGREGTQREKVKSKK
jgi:hypothetical protein